MTATRDELRKIIEEKESNQLRVDKPEVQIFEMKVDAISKLADQKNEIFSQINKREADQISRALVFAANPFPNVQRRLKEKGIDFRFECPTLVEYCREILIHRHKVDRKRVDEYIQALKTLQPVNRFDSPEQQRSSILGGRRII